MDNCICIPVTGSPYIPQMTFCMPQSAEAISLNPYEGVGIAHNAGLKAMQNFDVIDNLQEGYKMISTFLMGAYGRKKEEFIPFSAISREFLEVISGPYDYLLKLAENATRAEKEVYNLTLTAALEANSPKQFEIRLNSAIRKAVETDSLNVTEKAKLLGFIAVVKHSVMYWNSVQAEDYFDETLEARAVKPWLADAAGFLVGFVGTLVVNNNTPGNWNPFTNGTTVATAASAAVKGK